MSGPRHGVWERVWKFWPVNVEGPRPGTRCWVFCEEVERRIFWCPERGRTVTEYRVDWNGITIT